jgi:alanine dehydrogenase
MDGTYITATRTAAAAALAARLLARPDARVLAILGSGVQARAHLEAIARVLPFEQARVWSRTAEHAQAFAAEAEAPFPVEAVDSAEAAVRDADVVVTVTSAREPVVERGWLAPGAHVNAVGSSIPTARELDSATMAAAALFVDSRESTLNESGEYLRAVEEKGIGPDHIRAELGEVLTGSAAGRSSSDELTVFVSLGLAVEDLAAAEYLYRRALEEGVGSVVPF